MADDGERVDLAVAVVVHPLDLSPRQRQQNGVGGKRYVPHVATARQHEPVLGGRGQNGSVHGLGVSWMRSGGNTPDIDIVGLPCS